MTRLRDRTGPVVTGLSSILAQRRLTEFVDSTESVTECPSLFARQFASPVWLLLVGAQRAPAAWPDAGAIGAIVIVNAVIGFFRGTPAGARGDGAALDDGATRTGDADTARSFEGDFIASKPHTRRCLRRCADMVDFGGCLGLAAASSAARGRANWATRAVALLNTRRGHEAFQGG